jgi:nucleoside-diphosphate-sugar epimerase
MRWPGRRRSLARKPNPESKAMGYRIFLAGASGVIGRRLIPLLRSAQHEVVGMTRSAHRAASLRELGAEPVVLDVFDANALSKVLDSVRPQIVIHQLTDLPRGLDPSRMSEAITRNARIRDEGTRHLVQAAAAAGAHRLITQSIAWAYAPGAEPHSESDPLDLDAQGMRAVSVRGVAALERWTASEPRLAGVVLRYGQLYGPGTGTDAATGSMPLHVDAAAFAALLAVEREATGIFNIAEANAHVATDKARRELGWRAEFRIGEERS